MEQGLITAVGVDVSKGRSMVTVHRPSGQIVMPPIQVNHTAEELAGQAFARVQGGYSDHHRAYRYVLEAHRPLGPSTEQGSQRWDAAIMAGPSPGHVAVFPECSLAVQIGKFAASQCGEVASSAMGRKKIWPLLAAHAAREAKKEIGKHLRSVLFSVRPERAGHKRLFSFPPGCVSTLGGNLRHYVTSSASV